MAQAQTSSKQLLDEKAKLSAEIRKLNKDLEQQLHENSELVKKINMYSNSTKTIDGLREQLSERESHIQELTTEIGHLKVQAIEASKSQESL